MILFYVTLTTNENKYVSAENYQQAIRLVVKELKKDESEIREITKLADDLIVPEY